MSRPHPTARLARCLARCLAPLFALLALGALVTACGTELRGDAAVDACTELNAVFCERLADCDGSIDLDACVDANDALGGPCESATVLALPGDLESCRNALDDLACRDLEDRTNLTLPCPTIEFE